MTPIKSLLFSTSALVNVVPDVPMMTEEELRDVRSDTLFHLRRLGYELGGSITEGPCKNVIGPETRLPEIASTAYSAFRGRVLDADGKPVRLDTDLLEASDPKPDSDDWDIARSEGRSFDTHRHWWRNWFGTPPRRNERRRLYDETTERLIVFGTCMRIWCLNRSWGIGL